MLRLRLNFTADVAKNATVWTVTISPTLQKLKTEKSSEFGAVVFTNCAIKLVVFYAMVLAGIQFGVARLRGSFHVQFST